MKELEKNELIEVDGGVFWLIPVLVGVALAGVVTDWSGFKQSFMEGLNAN